MCNGDLVYQGEGVESGKDQQTRATVFLSALLFAGVPEMKS